MPTIDIDRDSAREAALNELTKPIYPDRSLQQLVDDVIDRLLNELLVRSAAVPGGWFTIAVLILGVLILAVVAVRTARRMVRTRRGDRPLYGAAELSAAEHRAAAERCAAGQDWAGAVRHRLRAVARELECGGVLTPAPGRTANELARDAGAARPQLADRFSAAAQTFNDVSYGELPATESDYRRIADLDDRLGAPAQPVRSR